MAALQLVRKPLVYTDELAKDICDRLANGETLTRICRDEDMPRFGTVIDWAQGNVAGAVGFVAMYARAKELQLAHMADSIQDIADDGTNDWQVDEDGNERVDHEHVQRSKLRVESRRWLLSKLRPDLFGDRIAHQQLDEHGKPARSGGVVII